MASRLLEGSQITLQTKQNSHLTHDDGRCQVLPGNYHIVKFDQEWATGQVSTECSEEETKAKLLRTRNPWEQLPRL